MKFSSTNHILLVIVACIPIYWASLFYIEVLTNTRIEELAVAATICCLGCIYIGRYLVQILDSLTQSLSNSILIILGLVIIGNIVWLAVHLDYPLQGRPGLKFFLYWGSLILLSVSVGMFIKLLRVNQYRLLEAKSSSAHSKSELQLLQSQLSPHFLFNTLNNLYGISLTRHEKIPSLLLKLSELLRYSVYEAKEPFVALKDEIAYINNYIDFEKIRIGERLIIKTSLDDFDPDFKIAPMLLIVFVENAFKHAKNSTDENIYVDIDLKTWADSILFSVRNSYQLNEGNAMPGMFKGFGLDNARKRLNLLYDNKYDLKLDCKEGFYHVMLQLKVK